MPRTNEVIVELFGIPRLRAGQSEVRLPAGTVAEVLAALEAACPPLQGLLTADGRLAPHYLLSLDGRAFLSEPGQPLCPGARLVLLTADIGG